MKRPFTVLISPSVVNSQVIHAAYGSIKSGPKHHHAPTPLHFLLTHKIWPPQFFFLHTSVLWHHNSGVLATAGCSGALFCYWDSRCAITQPIYCPQPLSETASCHGDWLNEASILPPHPTGLTRFKQPPEDGYTPQIMISPHQICYRLLSVLVVHNSLKSSIVQFAVVDYRLIYPSGSCWVKKTEASVWTVL